MITDHFRSKTIAGLGVTKKAGNQRTDGQNNYKYLRLILEIQAPNDKLLLGICLRGKTSRGNKYHCDVTVTVICVPPNTHP